MSTVAVFAADATTYLVASGDTLWAIARRRLDDPRRWRDIFELNRGRRQHDGRRLTDPRLILPGWHLRISARQIDTTRPAPRPTPAAGDRGAPSAPPEGHPPAQAPPNVAAGATGPPHLLCVRTPSILVFGDSLWRTGRSCRQ
jgi:hypothetical protein